MIVQMLRKFAQSGSMALAVLVTLALSSPASAVAEFDLLASNKFQQWEGNRFRNVNSGRQFCAAQTTNGDGAILRVNIYPDNREAFLELFNPAWRFREGGAKFSLSFDSGFSAELQGKSWGDSYTYDFLEQEKMDVVLGLMAQNREVRVSNSNGQEITRYSLTGATAAFKNLGECAGGF